MYIETAWNMHFINFDCYFLIGSLFISYLIYRILFSFFDDRNFIQTKYKVRGHTWRSIECNKSIPYNIDCTICGKLMLPAIGLFCECCGVSACKKCRRISDKKYRCKQITWSDEKPFYHLWVNVGVTTRENADHTEDCDNVIKYFCSWCQRVKLSSENLLNDTEECDLMKYKDIIIPPTSVKMEKGKIISIKPPSIENWEPLIILVTRKSGSNRIDELLSIFRGLLNPLQVIDIGVTGPDRIVKWLPEKCRILVAGGDGTVAWVLNSLCTVPHVKASVGILPMGTGNDLSRALGWGAGCAVLDAHSIIHSAKQAEIQILDRWKITIHPRRGRLPRLRPARVLHAYNYASVGVDAQVALDFHRARSQFLYRYASRYLNYVAYALLGVGRALDDGGCGGLERRLRVHVAGAGAPGFRPLPLPPLQALLLLNIRSWGAGVDLWSEASRGTGAQGVAVNATGCLGSEEDNVGEQRMDDGQLEVVGISSSFHIARLQCSLARPYRLAQGTHVRIELDGCCAMQVDGEPWMQGSATITMEPDGHSTMLRPVENICF